MVVALQNERSFTLMASLADRHNYLFRLVNTMLGHRLDALDSPKTKADFLLGVAAYQAITMAAFPEQPTFTHYPEELAAYQLVNQVGGLTAGELMDKGINESESMAGETPLLTEVTDEVVARYTQTAGSKRIAMGGAATMLVAHSAAEELLVA